MPTATRIFLTALVGRMMTKCVVAHTLQVCTNIWGRTTNSARQAPHVVTWFVCFIGFRQFFRSCVVWLAFGRNVDHSTVVGRISCSSSSWRNVGSATKSNPLLHTNASKSCSGWPQCTLAMLSSLSDSMDSLPFPCHYCSLSCYIHITQ